MGLLDILFYTFIVVVVIQVIYYLLFCKFAFFKIKEKSKKVHPVSVIICAKNEAENLQRFMPSVLDQDYPNFEVVLINDASYDNTLEVINAFALKDNRIKVVDVKNNEAFWANKKYALTLGIKAATHKHLLFTDADCKPISKSWISEMCSTFSSKKTIVLGYGSYKKVKNSLLNKLIRYETVLTAVQYFSFAKLGIPYMGVGRNLAYRKETFFNANGFMSHMQIRSGDDDLFINQVATGKNSEICISKDSFTTSIPEKAYKHWFKQKRRHVSTSKHYKLKHKLILALFYVSQILFWSLCIILLLFLFNWKIVLGLISFRLIIQFIVFTQSAKKLNEKDLIVFLPFLEIFLILSQLAIFITNLFIKPKHWN